MSHYKNSLWYHFYIKLVCKKCLGAGEILSCFSFSSDIVCVGGSCWKACRNLRIWLKAIKLYKYLQKLCTVSIGIWVASLWWNLKTSSACYLFWCECFAVNILEHLIWSIKIYLQGRGANTFLESTPMQEINYRKEFSSTSMSAYVCFHLGLLFVAIQRCFPTVLSYCVN